ncbi:MAG: dUTP diphosphatase [Spirochaetaceae bacterium]|jgi:dUTP pyrophosphatase|nr:dUTP diphosphatase [Spirochaetaceae bacterium]
MVRNSSGTPRVRVFKTNPGAVLPRYATKGAAGADVEALLGSDLTIAPGAWARVPTALVLEIPPGWEAQVRPRSGLALRHGVTVLNAPGTIDSDYRGELEVLLVNLGKEPYVIHTGDRIAQLVFAAVPQAALEFTDDDPSATGRGAGGFGSTGISKNK